MTTITTDSQYALVFSFDKYRSKVFIRICHAKTAKFQTWTKIKKTKGQQYHIGNCAVQLLWNSPAQLIKSKCGWYYQPHFSYNYIILYLIKLTKVNRQESNKINENNNNKPAWHSIHFFVSLWINFVASSSLPINRFWFLHHICSIKWLYNIFNPFQHKRLWQHQWTTNMEQSASRS